MDLSDEKKGVIFRALAEKPLYETGLSFGLDKHYSSAANVKAKVQRIYQEVQKDPSRYMISQELVDTIVKIVSNRSHTGKGFGASNTPSLREQKELSAIDDVSELVLSGRNKAFALVHKKLDQIGRNKKSLAEVSLAQLTTTAAILFDKGQIVQGQATENIAVLAKIDDNISPEDAMRAILGMREQNIIAKDKLTAKK